MLPISHRPLRLAAPLLALLLTMPASAQEATPAQEAAPPAEVTPAQNSADTMQDAANPAPEDDELLAEDDPEVDGPAAGGGDKGAPGVIYVPTITVRRTPEELAREGGSVQQLGEEDLKALKYDDPHSVLLQIPSVYARTEDGFGLRPNIGIRGANSERSKKVTLMEDGVLFGPAPYSAPAAYYFPMMQRMVSVEVFKGPGAILYGPQTIGGAINLITQPIVPRGQRGHADLAIGSYPSATGHLYYGRGWEHGGVLVEGIHIESDGFKELDNGGPTGFSRSELMVKGHINSSLTASTFHLAEIKLGFSRERSNETYLGLSDADFAQNPYRRYNASALDEMNWWRTQGQLTYELNRGETWRVQAALYRHDLDRSWLRFNSFADGTDASRVLANPDSATNRIYYDVLTGRQDSATPGEAIRLATNNRRFVSQGVQVMAQHTTRTDAVFNKAEVGVRLHNDSIRRDHKADDYDMRDGELVRSATPQLTTERNEGRTNAVAIYAVDQLSFWRLTLTPGARVEIIGMQLEELDSGAVTPNDQIVLIPGMGAYVQIVDHLGVLAGVHRGFSPVTPGQNAETKPETSINYELGARYLDAERGANFELIGFFNDYKNLIGECTFAAGCQEVDLDRQFNAGSVHVYGLEALAAYTFKPRAKLTLPTRLAYTLTRSSFQEAFSSENPQFEEVAPGDELPYVPQHQLTARVGASWDKTYQANVHVTYVGAMREVAGQADEGPRTDAYAMLDALVGWRPIEAGEVYLKLDNILNAEPIGSRRPFGARPIRPFMAQLGFRYDL
jgi:Fe(3+) dicitrate transport protein